MLQDASGYEPAGGVLIPVRHDAQPLQSSAPHYWTSGALVCEVQSWGMWDWMDGTANGTPDE
jgi:hypothetical protein